MYLMSYASPLFYHTNMASLSTTRRQSLIRHANFGKIGSPRRVECLAPLWEYRHEKFSQKHNDTLPSSETKSRVDYFAVDNLCSYSLAAPHVVEILALSVFSKERVYTQCGHRTNNLTNYDYLSASNRLSYAIAKCISDTTF